MERNKLVDCLRAYACLLVVFGHVIYGIYNMGGISQPPFAYLLKEFIWTFHVPLFLFLSGFVYRLTGEWRNKKTRWNFILHKAVNLGVPYLFFSVLYILINSRIPGTNSSYSTQDILSLLKTPVAQYWYLRTLFILFVMYTLFSRFFSNVWITIILSVINYLYLIFPTIPVFTHSISWAFVFGFGACIGSLEKICFSGVKAAVVIAIHLLLETVLLLTGVSGLPIVCELERVIGVTASVTLISLLIRFGTVQRFLQFISRYSFPIYLMHTFFTAGIRIILKRAGIDNYLFHVMAGTLMGVSFPILIMRCIEKKTWMLFPIYPVRTLELLKKDMKRVF